MSSEELQAIELITRVPYGRLVTTRRALPHLAVARHLVIDGHVVLRTHSGLGYHASCDGTVVAYGADNLNTAASGDGLWSVQFTGTAEFAHPAEELRARFGAAPRELSGEPIEPVYLRLAPRFVTVHTLGFHAREPNRYAA
jgi:Pyridoxamine 5'-phosphate oxidase